jgi:hypothetical protein
MNGFYLMKKAPPHWDDGAKCCRAGNLQKQHPDGPALDRPASASSLHQPESFEKGLNLKAIAAPNKACQGALRSHSDDPQWFGIASWSNG